MSRPMWAVAGAALLAVIPGVVFAQTTVASNRASWVTDTGFVGDRAGNSNTLTGFRGGEAYRSYISFAVPVSGAAFTSAVIRVNTATVANGPNDLTVYDVSSDIATETASTLYGDLGTGVVLGAATGLNTSNATIDITLNTAGLAAVNAARGGEISFGFVSSPISGASDGVFLASSGTTLRQLILTPTATPPTPTPVPTLSEWALLLLGLGLAGGTALHLQRHRRAA